VTAGLKVLGGVEEGLVDGCSVEVEDGVVYRLPDNEVVGITITDFEARTQKK